MLWPALSHCSGSTCGGLGHHRVSRAFPNHRIVGLSDGGKTCTALAGKAPPSAAGLCTPLLLPTPLFLQDSTSRIALDQASWTIVLLSGCHRAGPLSYCLAVIATILIFHIVPGRQTTLTCTSADLMDATKNCPLDWLRLSQANPMGCGLSSFIAVPIFVGVDVVGVLMLADTADSPFAEENG